MLEVTGSVAAPANFFGDPDATSKSPVPNLNTFSAQLLLNFFFQKCVKKFIHELKVQQQRFLEVFIALHAPKKYSSCRVVF
jgi:hypothetical protein